MSHKVKLFSTISAICLVIALLSVGVWAVTSANVTMGGTVTFSATNVYAKVTGTITGANENVTLDELTFTATSGPSQDSLKTWNNDLTFTSANLITMTITVENLSDERSLFVSVKDSVVDAENITKTMKKGGASYISGVENELGAKATVTYTMTIKVTDTNKSAEVDYAYNVVLKDAASVEPAEVDTADEFMTALRSSQSTSYFKLTENIDLTETATEEFSMYTDAKGKTDDECYALINSFKGVFDGNGKTITMNSKGSGTYAYLFGEVEGTIKNLKLVYDSVDVETALVYIALGDTIIENVEASGAIDLTVANGFSPFVQKAKGSSISFINCVNNVNVTAGDSDSYGSAFLGNRVYGTTSEAAGVQFPDYEEGADKNYMSKYIIVDNRISFINCVNNGNITMANAALLYGNSYQYPTPQNLIVENCVNNGQILGTATAGVISTKGRGVLNSGSDAFAQWHRGQYMTDLNQQAANGVSGTGVVQEIALDGFEVTITSATKDIVISNTNTDATYVYEIVLKTAFRDSEDHTFAATAMYRFTQTGSTGIKAWGKALLVDEDTIIPVHGTGVEVAVTAWEDVPAGVTLQGPIKGLRIAVTESGKKYYVFEQADGLNREQRQQFNFGVSVYEVVGEGENAEYILRGMQIVNPKT